MVKSPFEIRREFSTKALLRGQLLKGEEMANERGEGVGVPGWSLPGGWLTDSGRFVFDEEMLTAIVRA